MCGMLDHNYFFRAPSVPRVRWETRARFELISTPGNSVMQRNGIPMLYESAASQLPALYVRPVENVLGRVPLMPCYMMGTRTTQFRTHCGLKFQKAQLQIPG